MRTTVDKTASIIHLKFAKGVELKRSHQNKNRHAGDGYVLN